MDTVAEQKQRPHGEDDVEARHGARDDDAGNSKQAPAASPQDEARKSDGIDNSKDGGKEPDEKVEDKKDNNDEASKDDKGEKKPMSRGRKLLYIAIAVVAVAALAAGGGAYYLHARHFESTDDAFIDTHVSQIAPRVSGQVVRVNVDDNQRVEAGQAILDIDNRDYQVRFDEAVAQAGNARAQVAQAQAQIGLQQANIDQASSNVKVAQADLTQAQQDFERFKSIDPKAISRQQLDNSNAALRSANAKFESANQAVSGAKAQLDAAKAQLLAAEASLRQADTQVENAKLQLSYTHIDAPVAGTITKKNVAVGNFVNPGVPVMGIVPEEMWVTANFKENQLADMRIDQPVDIKVDAFPDQVFHGKIESFQSGSGTVFSTLPAENATGNYVKVVQRVPVKIVFSDDSYRKFRLAPGLSVQPRVRVR